MEGDSAGRFSRRERFLFLSTPSGWRATHLFSDCPLLIRFLSTPSGWRATTDFEGAPALIFISIHALRVEGDLPSSRQVRVCRSISIHALRVEGDQIGLSRNYIAMIISIHALRVEGDLSSCKHLRRLSHFYPRPPGGGRPSRYPLGFRTLLISIHALRVEGDSKNGQSFRLFLRKREKNLPL